MRHSRYDILLKVVECGSFSAAAEQLGYTQSAISQTIAALEQELGVTLLVRNKKGTRLSTDGRACLPHIREICDGENALRDRVAAILGGVSGHIRIGTFTSVSCHFLPGVIRTFQKEHPAITFQLLQGDYAQIEGWLLEGAVDIGFCRLPMTAKLDTVSLCKERMMAVLPVDHPLAGMPAVPEKYLERERLILLEEGSRDDASDFLRKRHITQKAGFRVGDDYTVMAFAEAGIGVGLLPEGVLRRSPYRTAARPVAPLYCRELGVACRDKNHLPAAARLFVEELYRQLAALE